MEGIFLILDVGTWEGYALLVVLIITASLAGYLSWLKLDKIFKIDKWVTKLFSKIFKFKK